MGPAAVNDEALDLVNKITSGTDVGMEDLGLGEDRGSLELRSSEDNECSTWARWSALFCLRPQSVSQTTQTYWAIRVLTSSTILVLLKQRQ